ncbi:hypothetical protein ACFX2I_007556 [Malus domestica]
MKRRSRWVGLRLRDRKVSKSLNPESVNQFWPISLCNYSYKDNIVIAHEVFHFLKLRKTKRKHELGIKLAMNKAYDRVEWDFLEATMLKMGFNRSWVDLVMRCTTSVELSATELGFIKGIRISVNGPTLSHLLFTDDTLIFLSTTKENCENTDRLLKTYCIASGWKTLEPTLEYLRYGAKLKRMLCPILRIGCYLRFRDGRISFYHRQREVLIKDVVQAVPTYPMNVFCLPTRLCNDIDGVVTKFWWANSDKVWGILRVNWQDIGLPKSECGMGFRTLGDFNLALLTKQTKGSFLLDLVEPLGCKDIILKGAHWHVLSGRLDEWSWDLSPISNYLSGSDSLTIVSSHFGDLTGLDCLIWRTDMHGNYTMKSGYRWIRGQRLQWAANLGTDSQVWKIIWGVVVTPKNLFGLGVPLAFGLIAISLPLLLLGLFGLRVLNLGASRKGRGLFPLLRFLAGRFGNLVTLCTTLPYPPRTDVQNRRPHWSPPPCDGVKVNVDASWRQGEVWGFVGVVIRDAQARYVEVCKLEVAAPSVLMAEALAIREGCAIARLRNFNQIYVESDSKLVISSLMAGMEFIP